MRLILHHHLVRRTPSSLHLEAVVRVVLEIHLLRTTVLLPIFPFIIVHHHVLLARLLLLVVKIIAEVHELKARVLIRELLGAVEILLSIELLASLALHLSLVAQHGWLKNCLVASVMNEKLYDKE